MVRIGFLSNYDLTGEKPGLFPADFKVSVFFAVDFKD